MLGFRKEDNQLVLVYTPEFPVDPEWASVKIRTLQTIKIKNTFKFRPNHLIKIQPPGMEDEEGFEYSEYETCYFQLAEFSGDYFKVNKGVLVEVFDIYIARDIEIDKTLFIADSDISIFSIVATLTNKDFYIGGDHPSAISVKAYKQLTDSFPTTHEKKLYSRARVAAVLRNYTDNIKDAENTYNRYMDKKISAVGTNLAKLFKDSEIVKYQTILEKLKTMLANEIAYTKSNGRKKYCRSFYCFTLNTLQCSPTLLYLSKTSIANTLTICWWMQGGI
jgi:hypothetical protein